MLKQNSTQYKSTAEKISASVHSHRGEIYLVIVWPLDFLSLKTATSDQIAG